MAQVQKSGKQKKLQRSGRMANHNKAVRPHRIKVARANHLKNARRSCGEKFAQALQKHYNANPTPGTRQHPKIHKTKPKPIKEEDD